MFLLLFFQLDVFFVKLFEWSRNRDITTEKLNEQRKNQINKNKFEIKAYKCAQNANNTFICVRVSTHKTRNGKWLIAVQITSNHEFIFIYFFFVNFYFDFFFHLLIFKDFHLCIHYYTKQTATQTQTQTDTHKLR